MGHKERNTSSSAVAMGLAGTPLVQDWQQYRQYKPGTHQPASGNHANLVKQSAAKPAVFRGEHGLPYVTDNAHAERYGMEEEAADTLPEIDNNAPLPDLANCMGGEERPPMPPAEHHPTATVSQYEVAAKHTKRELSVLKRRFQAELQTSKDENMRLKAQVAALKENCDQQAMHISDQARALDDIRRESQQDIAQAYRLNYAAERRAATMQARLGVAAADQERAFAAAAQQLEALRRERDTLSEALAAVAEAAVGGQDVSPNQIADEAAIAVAEGDDPLPRRPDAWLRFNYYTPPANAKRSRPTMRGDGERAVAALVAAVARLKKRTDRALHQEQAAMGQVDQLRDVMARVDEQYNLVVGAVDGLERELLQLQNHWGLQDTLASAERAGLPNRLVAIQRGVANMGQMMNQLDSGKKRVETQLLELQFYKTLNPDNGKQDSMPSSLSQSHNSNHGKSPASETPLQGASWLPPIAPPAASKASVLAPAPATAGTKPKKRVTYEDMTEDQAAVKLQAAARGHAVRREAKQQKVHADEDAAATKVQAAARGRAVRRQREKEEKAATKLQALHRGHMVRKSSLASMARQTPMVSHDEPAADSPYTTSMDESRAATKIQAVHRGRAVRKDIEKRKHEDEAAMKVRLEKEAEERAAVKMQAAARGHLVRKQRHRHSSQTSSVSHRAPTQEEEIAATKLQAAARGYNARSSMKKQRMEEDAAATKLQSNYRGYQTRKQMQTRKTGASASD